MKQLVSTVALVLAMLPASVWSAGNSPAMVDRIPLQPGLVIVSAVRGPQGDRENVVMIVQHGANGVRYGWNTEVLGPDGEPQKLEFNRFVRAVDLQKATRLHQVYWSGDKSDYPGYTGWTVSTSVFDAVVAGNDVPYMIVDLGQGKVGPEAVIAGLLRQTRRLRGQFRLAAPQPVTFPLLYDGVRVNVPARRFSGKFAADGRSENVEFWVLADRDHPLILKSIMGADVWQTIRIETPRETPQVEQELLRNCRVEIPGVYFAFGTADIDAQSDRALAGVGKLLNAHPDWNVVVEGHTDDVGSNADNLKLSRARADAVRSRLASHHAVDAHRMKTEGFGESRPRESNATIEGRARNRRVELVRPCPGTS